MKKILMEFLNGLDICRTYGKERETFSEGALLLACESLNPSRFIGTESDESVWCDDTYLLEEERFY